MIQVWSLAPRRSQAAFAKPCHMVQIDNDQLFAAGRPDRVGPYAYSRWPCFFYGPQDRGDLRPATCELRSFIHRLHAIP